VRKNRFALFPHVQQVLAEGAKQRLEELGKRKKTTTTVLRHRYNKQASMGENNNEKEEGEETERAITEASAFLLAELFPIKKDSAPSSLATATTTTTVASKFLGQLQQLKVRAAAAAAGVLVLPLMELKILISVFSRAVVSRASALLHIDSKRDVVPKYVTRLPCILLFSVSPIQQKSHQAAFSFSFSILKATLRASDTRFVRCIKTNDEYHPQEVTVWAQLANSSHDVENSKQ
jgi:hypothetical protein